MQLAPDQLAAIVEAAPVGLLATDADGRIFLYNRAAAALCATPAGSALGRPLAEVAPALAAGAAGSVTLAGKRVVFEVASAGRGRVFTLRPIDARRDAPPLRPARVLVADDNHVSRRVAAALLARLGLHCEVAGDGREALARLADGPFALVLMACQMPGLDGFAATAEIRGRAEPVRSLPIVALTSSTLRDDHERCMQAGMDAVVTRPLTLDGLAQALARWLGARQVEAIDAAALVELVAELGRAEVEELLVSLLEQVRTTLSQLQSAEAAGDLAGAGAAAHALLGAAGSLGATGLAASLRELERVCRWPAPRRLAEAVRSVEAAAQITETALDLWLAAH